MYMHDVSIERVSIRRSPIHDSWIYGGRKGMVGNGQKEERGGITPY